nr:monofunctional biosynthetic peptidoglycan transglycosylase [Lunatimonas salinarum]
MRGTLRKIVKSLLRLLLGLIVFSWVMVAVYRLVPVWITPLMVIRATESLLGPEEFSAPHQSWVPYERISPHVVLAVIASEDQKFPSHNGFDWEAIAQARKEIATGKRFRGGSTITNQTAKNVFLWPARNLLRKGLEAYFSLLIEFGWGKRRIMEVYLNVIEMGNGIYGIEEAARHYFKKSAADLSPREAALIAAVLPNPRRWNPAQPTNYIRNRQSWILRNMRNLGQVDL